MRTSPYNTAKAEDAYVADDSETYGKGIADVFEQTSPTLGGTVTKRDGIPGTTTDFTSYITALKGMNRLDYVYYGGVTTSGLGIFRNQMASQGLANIPFGGGDGIVDGPVVTGELVPADRRHRTVTPTPTAPPQVRRTSRATLRRARPTSRRPTRPCSTPIPGSYSAAAYACTQVFLQALEAVGPRPMSDLAQLREAVRAYVADPSNSYVTALGTFNFDAAGDTSQKIVSYWAFDSATQGWKFL